MMLTLILDVKHSMQEGISDMYHSITFGTVSNGQISGKNTWTDWHLIPSSRPTVAEPGVSTSMIEVPGRKNGPINSTYFLTNKIVYTPRSGSFEFLVDNDHENWESIRTKIVTFLHGQAMQMVLEDDSSYYYDGRFSLNEWRSDSWNSVVTINYVLKPYKYSLANGSKRL